MQDLLSILTSCLDMLQTPYEFIPGYSFSLWEVFLLGLLFRVCLNFVFVIFGGEVTHNE